MSYDIPLMSDAVLEQQSALIQNQDIRKGKDAIVSNRTRYITQLDKQTDAQYEAMCKMSPYYILYPKVVDGFTGTIFQKAPKLNNMKLTDGQKSQMKNIDMMNQSIDKYSELVVSNVLENGFCATYNDYSDILKRSFLRFVAPSQFVSFRASSEKGYPEITQFIYKEEVDESTESSEFNTVVVTYYIVLDVYEGVYRVRRFKEFRESSDAQNSGIDSSTIKNQNYKTKMELVSETIPRINGKPFTEIPIQIHGINSSNYTVTKSPLQDISDMNVSVFQRVVDQVYMLHWTALPTPYVIGVDDDDAPDTIGPTRVWHIDNDQAKVGMLEFTGQSAKAHQDFVDNLKEIMAATGAQILKKEGVSRETATSVLIRTAAQTSLIATLVKNISQQMQRVLRTYFDWEGIKYGEDFSYELNDDFIKVDMEPNAQIALVKSWLDGAISFPTMFQKMKEGEIIDPNRTYEEELDMIKKYPPPFFKENLASDLRIEEGEISAEQEAERAENEYNKNNEEITNGSNMDNGNINNEMATETAN